MSESLERQNELADALIAKLERIKELAEGTEKLSDSVGVANEGNQEESSPTITMIPMDIRDLRHLLRHLNSAIQIYNGLNQMEHNSEDCGCNFCNILLEATEQSRKLGSCLCEVIARRTAESIAFVD